MLINDKTLCMSPPTDASPHLPFSFLPHSTLLRAKVIDMLCDDQDLTIAFDDEEAQDPNPAVGRAHDEAASAVVLFLSSIATKRSRHDQTYF